MHTKFTALQICCLLNKISQHTRVPFLGKWPMTNKNLANLPPKNSYLHTCNLYDLSVVCTEHETTACCKIHVTCTVCSHTCAARANCTCKTTTRATCSHFYVTRAAVTMLAWLHSCDLCVLLLQIKCSENLYCLLAGQPPLYFLNLNFFLLLHYFLLPQPGHWDERPSLPSHGDPLLSCSLCLFLSPSLAFINLGFLTESITLISKVIYCRDQISPHWRSMVRFIYSLMQKSCISLD